MRPDALQKLLEYNPDTGVLVWKRKPIEMFKSERQCKRWNTRYAGRVAGCLNGSGYGVVQVDGCLMRSHRVAWALYYGEWPDQHIDHINGNRSDNRVSNLRLVTQSENAKNQKLSASNTTGFTGVSFHKNSGLWFASICVDGQKLSLGYYRKKSGAINARRMANCKYGFHQNHGRR